MSAHRELTKHAANLWKQNRSRVRWARMPKDDLANTILDVALIGLAGAAIEKIPHGPAQALASAFSLAFGPEKQHSPESEIVDAEFVEIREEKKK